MDARVLRELIFGRPLRSEDEAANRIGPLAGVPVLGLDALASAAYGPEAALTVLMPLGAAGLTHVGPITLLVVVLLAIVQASYRQTIAAYPDGGGAYTVASKNLGTGAGLIAGSALWIDFVLNVAVAISAGVGALVSAIPSLLPYTLPLCLGILTALTLINLRGVRDTGVAFMAPTYLFVASLGAVAVIGVAKVGLAGGHPTPFVAPARLPAAVAGASVWLLMRAFASGCTAMTGVEAVSNAVPVFREPRVVNARRTLSSIVVILGALLLALAVLCRAYHIGATASGHAGYQSVLSQVIAAVMGKGWFYYVAMAAIVAVLCLSANTSFAGFPRLCRVLALDGFLPQGFAHQSARLVYSHGIVLLAAIAGLLLLAFGGLTDRLIPLFAVGAFLSFTMSQWGMVEHWRRQQGGGRRHAALAMNALGALATGATLVVILVSKFVEGAWITVLLLAGLPLLFVAVRRHMESVERAVAAPEPIDASPPEPPLVVVPLENLDKVAHKALRFGISISREVVAVHVQTANRDDDELSAAWSNLVEQPLREAGLPVPRLVVLRSPYRDTIEPLMVHIKRLCIVNRGRAVAVLVPELVERKWYHAFLHGHRATLLKALLLLRGTPQIAVINTPWYL